MKSKFATRGHRNRDFLLSPSFIVDCNMEGHELYPPEVIYVRSVVFQHQQHLFRAEVDSRVLICDQGCSGDEGFFLVDERMKVKEEDCDHHSQHGYTREAAKPALRLCLASDKEFRDLSEEIEWGLYSRAFLRLLGNNHVFLLFVLE